ncbi:hypothetical protein EGY19_28410 [Burkholderia multivorans]|nr:hypothetical protein EGY20_06905 [Burkholderia multivorans]AYZ01931.1 hypothetical protein EGY19_28410 [Burkholderia multivorans]
MPRGARTVRCSTALPNRA